jgi:hypothetical protein
MEIICKCEGCGAITVDIGGNQYSMTPETYRKKFDVVRVPRIKQRVGSCDWCVNHYGLELCACGSGKRYKKCREGYSVCGKPMQDIETGRTKTRGGWLL